MQIIGSTKQHKLTAKAVGQQLLFVFFCGNVNNLKYMNNNVENDFFGLPKVKWLHLTGEVDKFVRCSSQIFSEFKMPKIIKIG